MGRPARVGAHVFVQGGFEMSTATPLDPAPIFAHFRGCHGTELLTAAVCHLGIFERVGESGRSSTELQAELAFAARPFRVCLTALRAMGLLTEHDGVVRLTPLADRFLVRGRPGFVGDYMGLAAETPGTLEMVRLLRANRPLNADSSDTGAAFVFREGLESAMEQEAAARRLTLALAGRAACVAPVLARVIPPMPKARILDVAAGSGIYAYEMLEAHPGMTAVLLDRPEVLKVAREEAARRGLTGRVEFVAADMFTDDLPRGCDGVLLSNVLHDWDIPECRTLVGRVAASLPPGGQVWIHDVFLDDDLSGPLEIALYSAALFTLTEGRAYSAAEYRGWLAEQGLEAAPAVVPTLAHCGLLSAIRPG